MTQIKPISFLDLSAQYVPIREEVFRAIDAVFDQTAFSGGTFVESFEEAFADYCGCRYAIGVGSGTDALWFALLALGIGPGDEVITVPNSFIATAEAVSICGARPVFVDVDSTTLTMDPAAIEAAISPRTKLIVPVHLFGQMADMDAINRIAQRHGIPVVEDAAQAHGAEYRGRRAGSLGLSGCFSFYPGKNLGALGEAGAVTTDDEDIAAHIRMLRNHGQARKHEHRLIGTNGRMDGIHGAVLKVKLRYLDRWNSARRELAHAYSDLLSGMAGIKVPQEVEYARHIYHIYAIRCDGRDELMRFLGERKISCAVHYPVPIHLQPAYSDRGLKEGRFPVAETAAKEMLSLPMYPELTLAQLRYICDCVSEWQDASARGGRRGNDPEHLQREADRV